MVKTRAKKAAKHKFTASIPKNLAEQFARFVNANGYVKERAIAGALALFMTSNDAARNAAISESN